MTTPGGISEIEEEFLHAAVGALGSGDGTAALESLGWWELVVDLDDGDLLLAAFTYFWGQCRCLAASPALCALLAQPFIDRSSFAPGSVVATISRLSRRRGPVQLLVGDPGDRRLLVDRPGSGAVVLERDEIGLTPVDIPGRLDMYEVTGDWSRTPPTVPEHDAIQARDRSTRLGRVAMALEMLGAAEGALALATTYSADRMQFGQPIGGFQAVRHLLAWAYVESAAISSVARQAVTLDRDAPVPLDEYAKAIAGRNGRRICERALQVLGGIGFTAEHDHHHHHGRVLAFDSILGTSSELTANLGSSFRTGATVSTLAAAVLAGP